MNKPRIIIVEDEAIVAQDIQQQLEAMGYEPVANVPTGEEALVLTGQLRPDLVLADIQLAGKMDGIELARIIRERFALPVVFLTAIAADETLDRAKLTEPFGYLLKPFEDRELRTVIEVALYKHQAETRLRHSYEDQASILRGAMDGFWLLDLQGRLLEANEAYCQMSGYTREELLRLSIPDLDAGWSLDAMAAKIESIKQAGCARFEQRHRCKDGRLIDVEVSVNYLAAGGRFFCFLRDITEHKRAEAVGRRAEEQYRSIFENAIEGIYQTTPQGTFLAANPAMARILGYDSSAALIRERTDIARQGYVDSHSREEFKRQLETHGGVSGFEYEAYRRDGCKVWVSENARAVRDEHGQVVCYEGSLADITERKRAEEALRESESRFRTVLETVSLIGVMLDRSGQITLCNDFLLALTGWKREAVMNQNWFDLFLPPEIRDGIKQEIFLKTIVTGDIPVHFENEIVTRKGERRLVVWNNTVLRDHTGSVVGVASIGDDITERKRAEAEKIKLEGQFQQAQKMESVGRLAGGVAHDFNNMLQAILGNAALALEEIPPGSSAHESLEEIQKAARRSAALTRQLLAFARRQTISPKVLDLNEAVEGLLKMLRRLIGENIDLAWLPATDLGPVKVDPTQIDQILANLCVNARDAIHGVGKLTIETGNAVFDEAYCADHPGFVPGEYVRLAVSDDGCGMDKATLVQIFEPFFTTKGASEGTGLGLATVYGIVKQNLGFIDVYSEPGQGTTFKIYLPRHAAQAAAIRTESAAELLRSSGETVLLVEDEAAILSIARRILGRLGYTVLTASTPGEAIQLAGTHTGEIQLLITDVVMPEMNGRDLARRLISLHPHIKCLFMSGYTVNVIVHQGVLDEGVHFIQKPFSVEDLANKVRKALEGE